MRAILKLLGGIPLRFYIYAAIAAAFAFVLWREDRATHQRDEARARAAAAEAHAEQLAGTIETMTVDAALKQETSNALVERLQAVERDRREHPLRVRCFTTAAPTVPAQGGSTAGSDDPAARRVDGSPELPAFEASEGLSEFQRRCAVNAAHQVTLQEFEAKRSH